MIDKTFVIRCFAHAGTEAVIALWRQASSQYGETSRPQRGLRLSIADKPAMQPGR